MKYFIDTEYTSRSSKNPFNLISIGIVSEEGREYYAINKECDLTQAGSWVKDNVIPLLEKDIKKKTKAVIRKELEAFIVDSQDYTEFWGYYCYTDLDVLYGLYDSRLDIPMRFPRYIYDLKHFSKTRHKLPKQTLPQHHALNDAKWIRDCYIYLKKKNLILV